MGRTPLSDQWTELLRIATAAQPLWNRARSPSHEEAEVLREFNKKATPQTIGDLLTERAALAAEVDLLRKTRDMSDPKRFLESDR